MIIIKIKDDKYYNVAYSFANRPNFLAGIACKQGRQQTNHPRKSINWGYLFPSAWRTALSRSPMPHWRMLWIITTTGQMSMGLPGTIRIWRCRGALRRRLFPRETRSISCWKTFPPKNCHIEDQALVDNFLYGSSDAIWDIIPRWRTPDIRLSCCRTRMAGIPPYGAIGRIVPLCPHAEHASRRIENLTPLPLWEKDFFKEFKSSWRG